LKENWTGVRPVRFREEIYGALGLIASRNEGLKIEELRNYMLKLRLEREDRRLKALQKSITLENRKRRKPKLLTKVEQMIRVFRKTNMIIKDGEVLRSTENSRKLVSMKQQDEIAADSFFLECLVNSRFTTYWLFLKQLFKCRQIVIPSSIPERDKKLREHVNSKGFPLDPWSFFILRDLFYEFSLLNYVIDETSQVIFPLYTIEKEMFESHVFECRVRGPDAYLYFWPKAPEDFVTGLVDVYLSLSDNKWNRMIDLIMLRERYSYRFTVPERQFDIMLQQALKQETRYRIVPSVGHVDIGSRSTYITKALSLPYNRFGLPYTMMRIGVGDY
jgi:hypothetical protein